MRETDWEVTQETIEEQVARESYLQWLRDQEKRAKQHNSVPTFVRRSHDMRKILLKGITKNPFRLAQCYVGQEISLWIMDGEVLMISL